jgi:hypothetical protein
LQTINDPFANQMFNGSFDSKQNLVSILFCVLYNIFMTILIKFFNFFLG